MSRHIKSCNEHYEKGFRLKHIPGEFNTQRVYVSIEKEGIALDKTICKQEPIFDEYDHQQPEHLFEAPTLEELPLNQTKKRISSDITQETRIEDIILNRSPRKRKLDSTLNITQATEGNLLSFFIVYT